MTPSAILDIPREFGNLSREEDVAGSGSMSLEDVVCVGVVVGIQAAIPPAQIFFRNIYQLEITLPKPRQNKSISSSLLKYDTGARSRLRFLLVP